MKKVKNIFNDSVLNTKIFFVNLYKNTIKWFISLWHWILNIPHSLKNEELDKNNIIALPANTKKWVTKQRKKTAKEWMKGIRSFLFNYAIIIALVILIIIFDVMNQNYLSARNITQILKNSSYRLLFALGVGTIIVAKSTDLSAGRVAGFTALIVAVFSQDALSSPIVPSIVGQSPILIIIISMLVGIVFGYINGVVVTKFHVDPFIATLGMMLIAYGGSYFLMDKFDTGSIGGLSSRYVNIVEKPVISFGDFQITWAIIIALLIAFIMWIVWNKTPFGKKMYAIGGNASAAKVSGIKYKKVFLMTFVIGGALYGIGATLLTWSAGAVSAQTATMYELDAIAAVIVGGLSFDGGRGKISGVILGVILFESISVGFTIIGMQVWMTYLVKGIIVIAAVSFDMLKVRKKI